MNKIIALIFSFLPLLLFGQPASLLRPTKDDCNRFIISQSSNFSTINLLDGDTIVLDTANINPLSLSNYFVGGYYYLWSYKNDLLVNDLIFTIQDSISHYFYGEGWNIDYPPFSTAPVDSCLLTPPYPDLLLTTDSVFNRPCLLYNIGVFVERGTTNPNPEGWYYARTDMTTNSCSSDSIFTIFYKVFINRL